MTELTYRVTKYPSTTRLKKSEVSSVYFPFDRSIYFPLQIDDTMKTAFGMWQAVTDLTFQQKSSGSVHIEIRFEK